MKRQLFVNIFSDTDVVIVLDCFHFFHVIDFQSNYIQVQHMVSLHIYTAHQNLQCEKAFVFCVFVCQMFKQVYLASFMVISGFFSHVSCFSE